ncbi:MAG: TonB-dependent receptor, partial [Flavobacteriales bacterium]|nr:TonB-dependent receptor [Flavobacteriales bacterium]
ESSVDFGHSLGGLEFRHRVGATYADSRNLEPAFEGDQSENKQLIYTPVWSLNAVEEMLFGAGKYRLVCTANYMSERFVNFDNSLSLPPFLTVNLAFTAQVPLEKSRFTLSGACNNIFDTAYQLQSSHNMPGINFEIGIKYQLQKK